MTVKHACPAPVFKLRDGCLRACGATAAHKHGDETWYCAAHHPDRMREHAAKRAAWRLVPLATVREIIESHARDCGCATRILDELDKEFGT